MIATRAMLAVVWLGLAGYLLWHRNEPGAFGPWTGWFALMFAGYNVFRCWSGWSASQQIETLQRRRQTHGAAPDQREYNEAFDFDRDRTPDRNKE